MDITFFHFFPTWNARSAFEIISRSEAANVKWREEKKRFVAYLIEQTQQKRATFLLKFLLLREC